MSGILDASILTCHLAQRGVRYLRVAEAIGDARPLDTETLIAALARHPEPRLREALIPLFIRHPEYAPIIPRLVAALERRRR